MALKWKGLNKACAILSSAISEWKWPSDGVTGNSETMPSINYDDGFDLDSRDDEIHIMNSR